MNSLPAIAETPKSALGNKNLGIIGWTREAKFRTNEPRNQNEVQQKLVFFSLL
jgi:protein tyrosine/serine phosphatase